MAPFCNSWTFTSLNLILTVATFAAFQLHYFDNTPLSPTSLKWFEELREIPRQANVTVPKTVAFRLPEIIWGILNNRAMQSHDMYQTKSVLSEFRRSLNETIEQFCRPIENETQLCKTGATNGPPDNMTIDLVALNKLLLDESLDLSTQLSELVLRAKGYFQDKSYRSIGLNLSEVCQGIPDRVKSLNAFFESVSVENVSLSESVLVPQCEGWKDQCKPQRSIVVCLAIHLEMTRWTTRLCIDKSQKNELLKHLYLAGNVSQQVGKQMTSSCRAAVSTIIAGIFAPLTELVLVKAEKRLKISRWYYNRLLANKFNCNATLPNCTLAYMTNTLLGPLGNSGILKAREILPAVDVNFKPTFAIHHNRIFSYVKDLECDVTHWKGPAKREIDHLIKHIRPQFGAAFKAYQSAVKHPDSKPDFIRECKQNLSDVCRQLKEFDLIAKIGQRLHVNGKNKFGEHLRNVTFNEPRQLIQFWMYVAYELNHVIHWVDVCIVNERPNDVEFFLEKRSPHVKQALEIQDVFGELHSQLVDEGAGSNSSSYDTNRRIDLFPICLKKAKVTVQKPCNVAINTQQLFDGSNGITNYDCTEKDYQKCNISRVAQVMLGAFNQSLFEHAMVAMLGYRTQTEKMGRLEQTYSVDVSECVQLAESLRQSFPNDSTKNIYANITAAASHITGLAMKFANVLRSLKVMETWDVDYKQLEPIAKENVQACTELDVIGDAESIERLVLEELPMPRILELPRFWLARAANLHLIRFAAVWCSHRRILPDLNSNDALSLNFSRIVQNITSIALRLESKVMERFEELLAEKMATGEPSTKTTRNVLTKTASTYANMTLKWTTAGASLSTTVGGQSAVQTTMASQASHARTAVSDEHFKETSSWNKALFDEMATNDTKRHSTSEATTTANKATVTSSGTVSSGKASTAVVSAVAPHEKAVQLDLQSEGATAQADSRMVGSELPDTDASELEAIWSTDGDYGTSVDDVVLSGSSEAATNISGTS